MTHGPIRTIKYFFTSYDLLPSIVSRSIYSEIKSTQNPIRLFKIIGPLYFTGVFYVFCARIIEINFYSIVNSLFSLCIFTKCIVPFNIS